MALPFGWTQNTGTDVTDSDFSTVTKYIGDTSFEFKATAVATQIVSGYIEIALGQQLEISFVFRRTSGTGAFSVSVGFYDAAKNQIGLGTAITFQPIANGVWTAVRRVFFNSLAADNRVRFVRITVGKASATAEQFFLGALDLRSPKRGFKVVKTADQTVATGAEDLVTWTATTFDYGNVFGADEWNPAADNTGAAHARKHFADYQSVWQFNARIYWDNLSDTERGSLFLVRNGSTYEAVSEIRSSGGGHVTNQVAEILLMEEDDTLDVRASHSSGSSRVISATSVGGKAGTCSFSGWELSP